MSTRRDQPDSPRLPGRRSSSRHPLRFAREAAGLSRVALSARNPNGFPSPRTIADYERGITRPGSKARRALAASLGVSVQEVASWFPKPRTCVLSAGQVSSLRYAVRILMQGVEEDRKHARNLDNALRRVEPAAPKGAS